MFGWVGRVYCVPVFLMVGRVHCVAVVLWVGGVYCRVVVMLVFGTVWVGEVGRCSIGWNLGLKVWLFLLFLFFFDFLCVYFVWVDVPL